MLREDIRREALALALFCISFYLAYRYGMSFSQQSASPFWFPDAVLLCALLLTSPRRWWLYVLAALPIRLLTDVARDLPLWFLIATFLIDSAKGLLTAIALRHYVGTSLRFQTLHQFGLYVLIAVVTVPALGAFGGAAARSALGHDYWAAWHQWFMGDALAQLVLTPAICYWIFGWKPRKVFFGTPRMIEASLLTIGLVAATYIAANTGEMDLPMQLTRLYAPMPFLFWAAVRFGMFGAAGAITLFATVVIHAALRNSGPFAALPPADTAFALQSFLLLRAAPVYLVAVVVEQHWRIESSLRESEERFRDIANAAPVMIWLVDHKRRNEFSNESGLAFVGRTLQQEQGEGWADGVHPDDRQRVITTFAATFARRERFDSEHRHRHHDGTFRWVHSVGVPRYARDGDFLGYVGTVVDITDRKCAEEATRALGHAQRLAVMGALTAIIAHEIRQPLSAILLNAETTAYLLRAPQPRIDELQEILTSIRDDALRAEDTIRAIRSFVSNQPSRREAIDINTLIIDVLRLVASDAKQRHVPIRHELTPNLPQVQGDATQLQQILVNLIMNAMAAQVDVPEGDRYVTISSLLREAEIEVAVRDGGCGIPADKMPQLFDSFFTTTQQGMGLGLSIVRSLVTEHRGRVWAANNPEGGATFWFTVPLTENVVGETAARTVSAVHS